MSKQKWKRAQKRDVLDNETLQYYRRISLELKQDFEDNENKGKRERSLRTRTPNSNTTRYVCVRACLTTDLNEVNKMSDGSQRELKIQAVLCFCTTHWVRVRATARLQDRNKITANYRTGRSFVLTVC